MGVITEDNGKLLGTVIDILETGANDVFILRDQLGSEILIPDIESVIIKVDTELNQIQVRLLPGLLSDDE